MTQEFEESTFLVEMSMSWMLSSRSFLNDEQSNAVLESRVAQYSSSCTFDICAGTQYSTNLEVQVYAV